MLQGCIKKLLRTWLKKRVYRTDIPLKVCQDNFLWVYSAPLSQWRNRIWCAKTRNRSKALEYLYS